MPHQTICLVPFYQSLARSANASYERSAAAYRVAVHRGFNGKCLTVLVGTRNDAQEEQQLAASTDRMARDIQTIAAVFERRLPASDVNPTHNARDVATFKRLWRLALSSNGPTNLSLCPHK